MYDSSWCGTEKKSELGRGVLFLFIYHVVFDIYV